MTKAFLMLFVLILASTVFAQPQQFAKFPLSPSYVQDISSGKPVTFILAMNNINFTKIISVEAHFSVFQKDDTTYFLTIDGVPCDVPKYFAQGSGQHEIIFDCTTGVSGIRKYALELTQSNINFAPLSSAYGWAETTYLMPEPETVSSQLDSSIRNFYATKPSMSVHGTEYTRGIDIQGKDFIQLLSGNETIDNATCRVSSFAPDNSFFIEDELMTFLKDGIYTHNFNILPNMSLGVYPVSVRCDFPILSSQYNVSTFQQIRGTNSQGGIQDTNFTDGVFMRLSENLAINRSVVGEFNFTNVNFTGNTTNIDLSATISWTGGGNGEVIQFLLFNFTSGAFIIMPTTLPDVNGYTTATNNIPKPFSDFINSGVLRIRVKDSEALVDAANSNADIDQLILKKTIAAPVSVVHLQGSGEIHVSANPLFYANVSIDETNITAYLSSINNTINRIENIANAMNISMAFLLSNVQENNLTLRRIEANTIVINGTANNIFALASDMNLTLGQVAALASATNMTSSQILSLLQSVNATMAQQSTSAQILGVVQEINLTQKQHTSLLQEINGTTLYNQLLLLQINASINKNIYINVTNTTVVVNTTNTTVNVAVTNVTIIINQTNTTVVVNVTNATFSPVIVANVTFMDNSTVNVTLVDNSTHIVNFTFTDSSTVNVTLVDNSTHLVGVNLTINQTVINAILNVTNTTVVVNVVNTTYVDNNTFTTLLVNTTNTTVVVNTTNTIVVENITNTTVIVSVVNTTVIVNTTNTTTNFAQVLAAIQEVNSTTGQNQQYLINITAMVKDLNLTAQQTLALVQSLQNNINANFSFIINNVTVKTNISEIVEAVLGADVTQTVITASPILSSPSPVTGNFLGGVAYAQGDNGVVAVCLANNTLLSSLTVLRCVNNVCNTIVTNATQTCQFGCDDTQLPNRCNPSAGQTNIWVLGIAFLIVFVAVFLLLKIKNRR